jgi:hypothetical protein
VVRKIYVWISRRHEGCQRSVEILELKEYLGQVAVNVLDQPRAESPGGARHFINRKVFRYNRNLRSFAVSRP